MMHKPASKAASHILLRRLKEHELLLHSLVFLGRPHLPIASHEDNLIILAVRISGYTIMLSLTLLLFPVRDELAHLALKVHEQALRAAGALELLAQLFGNNAGGCGLVGYGLGSGLLGYGCGLALVGLALEACIPERGEVVGDVLGLPCGVDFPVSGEGRFGVWVVEEVV
jgi:hypothetical protein